MGTIKIKSTDKKSQGDYVLIDEAEFDPKLHKKLTEAEEAAIDEQAVKAAAKADKAEKAEKE